MRKGFKEYFGTGGFAMGSIDSITPVVSLGPTDRPPVGSKSKDSRSMGLPEQGKFKAKIMKKLQKPINDYLKKKKLKEDGMVGPGIGTYEPSGSLNPQRGTTKKGIADGKNIQKISGLDFRNKTQAKVGVGLIKSSPVTVSHKIQAASIMATRAKTASEGAKNLETKKSLEQSYEIYQNYINESN